MTRVLGSILGLAVLAFAGTAQADEVNKVVAPAAQSQVDISIYGQRGAQIQEIRTVTLKEGQNEILLDGIASNYRPDSLRLIAAKGPGSFRFRSATYQPATLTTERILSDSLGKDIEVFREQESIKGKLLSYNGGVLTIQTGAGLRLVSSSDIHIPQAPTGLSNTASIVIEASVVLPDTNAKPEYQLTFSYETNGLGWTAKHNIVYDDAHSKLENWQTIVTISNSSGATYKGATLRLLSAQALGNDAPGGMYKASAMRAAVADAAPSSESAAVEDVGDQKTYTVPGAVNLEQGQTRQIVLLDAQNVPVKREYFVPAYAYGDSSKQASVSIRLTIENCEKHHLGKALPAGMVKVYQYNAAGVQMQTGGARIGDKAQDEIFDMVIGTSSDVKYTRTLVEQTDNLKLQPAQKQGQAYTPFYEDQTWEVKVFNYKRDRDVNVKVEVQLPVDQVVAPPLTKKSASQAEATINVAPSGTEVLRYKTKVQVR